MAIMYHFIFWFSTRFGSAVVAIFTLAQSVSCLIASIIGLENQDAIQRQLDFWLRTYNILFMKDTVHDMKREPEGCLVGLITYFSLHCISCFLMLYGTLRVSLWFVYPFLALEIARLVFLTVSFVIAMLLVKENIVNLGLLIGSCCGGGFVLLYLFYQWFCVLSFIQIVKELELVYKLGHYEKGKLNLHKYQRMNVLELGAEHYPKIEDCAPVADYSHHYNKKSMNENINARFSIDSDYSNVMARPVY